jgi:hypothetical protein
MFLLAVLVGVGGVGGPAQDLALEEPSGARLVVEDGRLVRVRGGERVELGCTLDEGPGSILALAADPAGLTFVATERGLFVLGPYVDVLDPLIPLEGAPHGRPNSIHVDAARRVWYATEEGVGVLEPSHFYGRRLTSLELPTGVAFQLGPASGGRLAIRWDGGERVHDPSADPPRLTAVRVDGESVASGAQLVRDSGGTLALELAGQARGGATFRYRVDGHHVWRAIEARAELPMPHPGKHTLEFVALDEDLDRSPPFLVRVQVAYPFYFSGSFVLATVFGGAALALVFFLRSLRGPRGGLQPARALVSAALLVVLVLQLVAGLEPHAKGWPFVGFGMYTQPHRRDECIYAERIVVLHPDGRESVVRIQSAGVIVDEPWEVLRPLIDQGEPALRAYLAAWSERHPAENVCGVQVQAQRARLTPQGPVNVAPLVLAHFREGRDG